MGKTQAQPLSKQEQTEFPVSLDEFLAEQGKKGHESRMAFAALMKAEKNTSSRTRAEWVELFTLFMTKPVAIAWPEWIAQNTKEKGGN